MADKTIDDLTALGAAPAGGSYVPVWESGATKKVSVSNLLTNAGGGIEFSSAISGLGSETGQVADGDTLLEGLAKINDRVALSGNETVAGEKTFSGDTHFSSGNITGADPDNKITFYQGFSFYNHAGEYIGRMTNAGFTLASNDAYNWASTDTAGGTVDTGLQRGGAGIIEPIADDTHDLGSPSYRFDDIYATNTTIQSSDERLKTEVQPVSNALDLVNRLNPVSYKWKDYDFETTHTDADGNVQTVTSRKTHSRRHWGLIAQEFKTALENAGLDPAQVAAFIDPAAAGQEGNMGIRYGELVAVALAAIKELSARVEALEA